MPAGEPTGRLSGRRGRLPVGRAILAFASTRRSPAPREHQARVSTAAPVGILRNILRSGDRRRMAQVWPLFARHLDTAQAERGRKSLSGRRFFSGAWDLADPVYKVHPLVFSALDRSSAQVRSSTACRWTPRARNRPLTPKLARSTDRGLAEPPNPAGGQASAGRSGRTRLGASGAPRVGSCRRREAPEKRDGARSSGNAAAARGDSGRDVVGSSRLMAGDERRLLSRRSGR
jgi:hypothetical protein